MLKTRGVLLFALLALAAPLAGAATRIVSLGGAVTEILFALGVAKQVVAVDATSIYPPAADALPDVGYLRTLAPEPILALQPDLIIYEQDAGPPETLAQLSAAGVAMLRVGGAHDVTTVAAKIRAIAAAVSRDEAGATMIAALERDMEEVRAMVAQQSTRPRVLFALQFDEGSVMAAGRGTAADAMIAMAGADNVGAAFEGYKAIGGEALLAAAPDVIVTMERAVSSYTPPAEVLKLASVRLTPAARDQRLVVMDGLLLLGFGPRLGLATRQLAQTIHSAP